MLAFVLVLWQALGFPEVEDPIPDRIGVELPFAFAGAIGVVAGMLWTASSRAKRERAISLGSLIGFCIGAGFYVLSLLVQIAYNL